MYDAIVAGAGPVGSYVARALAGNGYKTMVLEQHPEIGNKRCCTGIVGKECFEQFPVFNGSVLTQARSAVFFSPSGKELRLSKETPQAFVVDRQSFDRSLARKAMDSGAEYLLEAKVDRVEFDGTTVQALVCHKGKTASVSGRLIVVASGFSSSLPEKLGLGRVRDFAVGAQAQVSTSATEIEVYFGDRIAPGFFSWLVPISEGKALAGVLSRRRPAFLLNGFLSNLALQRKIASPAAQISVGGVPLTPLARTYGDRFLIVGDAAGQVKPSTCGGIYYGLLSAHIAATIASEALAANDLSAKRLSRYQKAWKKKLSKEMRIDYFARRLYERLTDRQIDELFELVQSNGIHETMLQSDDFSFDWHGGLFLKAFKHGALRRALWSMTRTLLPF